MGVRYLTDLADVLRSAGLTVIEVDGWGTRARSSGGLDGTRPWCVMWHHTASQTSPENDVSYIVYGCPDAPVANLYLDRDGTVWVCAAGAANTNGKGAAQIMTLGVIPADQMNTHAIGIEAANSGLGEVWPREQIDAYFTVSNALAAAYGLQPGDCCTHNSYAADRKIDPATADAVEGPWQPAAVTTSGTWSVDDIRDECWLRSDQLPPTPPGDDDMNTAVMWKPAGYANVFLVGVGSVTVVSPLLYQELTGRGVPLIVEADGPMRDACLYQTGMTLGDLTPE